MWSGELQDASALPQLLLIDAFASPEGPTAPLTAPYPRHSTSICAVMPYSRRLLTALNRTVNAWLGYRVGC